MAAAEKTDAELLAEFAGGSAEAMGELIGRYRKPLFGWFAMMAPDRATAEDLYQDVWLRIVRGASSFHDVSFRAWMWRIARNRLIDFRRKMRPELTLDRPVAGGEGDPAAPTGVDRVEDPRENAREAIEGGERLAALRSAVARLPEIHREIVYLRTVECVSFKEIAERLGISINTALGRMHDATQRLRRELGEGR